MSHCQYHPLKTAIRTCENCDHNYCDACSDESALRHNPNADYACFICGFSLLNLKAESEVEPFWRRLGDIYLYPMSVSALIVLVLTAFLAASFSQLGILQLLPEIAISLYSFACLRETAHGNMKAPGVEACFEGSIKPVISVVFVMVFAIFSSIKIFDVFGTGLGILAVFFYVVTLPAAILVIAIEGDFFPAINPHRLMTVVSATGTSYFVMLIFLFIMLGSVGLLSSFVFSEQLTSFSIFTQSLISNYYGIVTFHILGYLVYQNRYKLGFEGQSNITAPDIRDDAEWLNAKLEVLIKSGDYKAAIDLAKQQVAASNSQLWQWSRCFKLMCTGKSFKELGAFAPKYFDKLALFRHDDELADSYVMLKKRIRDFQFTDPERCMTVAHSLFDLGQYPYVVDMLSDFHERDADDALINDSLKMVRDSYQKMPGKEKNAQFFQNIYDMRNPTG
jgi:tetratricopeptide (TPR) repeat protein